MSHFTPTEARMLELLLDCQPHSIDELTECLYDVDSGHGSVRVHLSRLRTKLTAFTVAYVEGSYRLVFD